MPYLRDRVIVLKKEPFREQDRRYTMFGREHGFMVAVARGSALKKSKQAGHLEPFSESEVMIAKGSAFDKLAVGRQVSAPKFPPNLSSYAVYGGFCDLVISLSRPGISDERIFELLIEVRAVCAGLLSELSPGRARLLLASATLKLLDLAGFAPPLDEALNLPAPAITLIKFLRRFSVADALRVTAPLNILDTSSSFVEGAVSRTPLVSAPHGPLTVRSLLVDSAV